MYTRISLLVFAGITAILTESYSLAVMQSSSFFYDTRAYQWAPFFVVLVLAFVAYIVTSHYKANIVFGWKDFIYYYFVPYVLITVIVAKYTLGWYVK